MKFECWNQTSQGAIVVIKYRNRNSLKKRHIFFVKFICTILFWFLCINVLDKKNMLKLWFNCCLEQGLAYYIKCFIYKILFLVGKREIGNAADFFCFCNLEIANFVFMRVQCISTLKCTMSQNGQAHFKNLAACAAKFLKCVWPFWDVIR